MAQLELQRGFRSRGPSASASLERDEFAHAQSTRSALSEATATWWWSASQATLRPRIALITNGSLASVNYAIDWNEIIAENRSHGKKHAARFHRSFLKLKVQQLLHYYTYVCN